MARPISHDARLRDRMLEAAAASIDRDGPQRFSVREVAAAAGTSTTAVYSLFGSKADLLAAVVSDSFASFARAQEAAASGGLRALGVAYREWALAHPDRYRLMFGGGSPTDPHCDGPEAAAALLPLARALAGTAEIDEQRDLLPAVVVWAQVHGAVSLELAAVAPPMVPADDVYTAVLDTIAAAHPGR